MIGADPEFEIYRDNRYIYAANVIRGGLTSRLGTDACSSIGEIRPHPGTPEEVIQSIDTILDEGYRQLRNCKIYSGAGTNDPIGGHIHFSGVSNDPDFRRTLDVLIGIPLRDISNHASIRSHSSYGNLGEYRVQPHGWEYRTPCSWISHPYIAEGVLTVAYEAAKMYADNYKTFNTISEFIAYTSINSTTAFPKIKKFYDIIHSLLIHNRKLEEVEIFQAWKKSRYENVQGSKLLFHWRRSDDGIPEIMRLVEIRRMHNAHKYANFTTIDVQIVGASIDRTHLDVVFLPEAIRSRLSMMHLCKVRIRHWDLAQIGISHPLRAKTELAAEVISEIRWRFPKTYLYLIEAPIQVNEVIRMIEEA